jgi:hypothetical protein
MRAGPMTPPTITGHREFMPLPYSKKGRRPKPSPLRVNTPSYSDSAANPNVATGGPPPARPYTIAIPVTAPPTTVAVVTMTVVTVAVVAVSVVAVSVVAVSMTVTMSMTSERRGRHQQCGSYCYD